MAPSVNAVAWQPKEGTISLEEFFRLIMRMCRITLETCLKHLHYRKPGLGEAWSKFSVCVQVVMLLAFFLSLCWLFGRVMSFYTAKSSEKPPVSWVKSSWVCLLCSSVCPQLQFRADFTVFLWVPLKEGRFFPAHKLSHRTAWQSWENPNLLASQQPHQTGLAHTHRAEGWFVSVSSARHGLCLLSVDVYSYCSLYEAWPCQMMEKIENLLFC